MTRTSTLYPPCTGYTRPTIRKFFVWRDRFIRYDPSFAARRGWEVSPYRWCCTFCDPPSFGFRSREGALNRILTVSMPRHFEHRRAHHAWAARKPPAPGAR